jgi:putative oxidoreductase
MAAASEAGSGLLFAAGLLTPLAAAGVVGVMVVAWITNHRGNGFFIFRPGEGYEYVLNLVLAGCAIGALGAGGISVDAALGLDLAGWFGLAVAIVAGGGGAALLLLTSWRPRVAEEQAS